jgi:DedD protein
VNTRYDTDLDEPGVQDREISLGTTTILGIFFALALLCAVFFGFGYSMGRRSAQPVANPAEVTTKSENSTSKPAPGSPASQAAKPTADPTQSAVVPLDSPNAASDDNPQPPTTIKAAAPSPRVDTPAEPTPKPSKPAGLVPVAAALPSPGSSVVQVAAMSHQEDADVVAADLKRRGYAVAIRREPQDKLFHVQIGPFPTKKEADTMRQRLQTDGYNSVIVK